MPGNWPTDLGSHSPAEATPLLNPPISPISEESQQSRTILPYPLSTEERLQVPRSSSFGIEAQSRPTMPFPSSPSAGDGLIFDYSFSSRLSTMSPEEEGPSTSYLIFEPVVEENSNVEDTDWRRYDPPQELLRSRESISHDLEFILAPSIERIQARHVEEEERRAASRRERPLARARKAFIKPRHQVRHPRNQKKIILIMI